MKIAESWLRAWVNPDLDSDALAHQLTMLGHEVDAVDIDGVGLDDVVVAEVKSFSKHPDADKLNVCEVDDGSGELVTVVCGAPNVTKGMKTPLARPGVKLPNGAKLRKAKIRGVVSNGMLCSAVELGLGEESDGIMELPNDVEAGARLVDVLQLPDAVIDLDLTPNRGDCFSVLGIARDIAALTGATLTDPARSPVAATIDDQQAVELVEPAGCPRFAGRIIRDIDATAQSPLWMTERLRRSGLRSISPVVDVTNYVMLELGQPLHAYDASKLKGTVRPTLAAGGERLTLLDEKEITLQKDTLVITDDSGVIGLAGIMGGLSTAVSDSTSDVYFEAAFWPQDYMAGKARAYGMHTDASLRFERGVDPAGQERAVERATELLLSIAGGRPGPTTIDSSEDHIPVRKPIRLRKQRLDRLLGISIDGDNVSSILRALQLDVSDEQDGWTVTAPSHRFDIEIEADLVEEVARIHGYESIPATTASAQVALETVTETTVEPDRIAATLIARDYQEVINYSFIDSAANNAFTGEESALVLSNPISSEMSVMRASLVPGLVETAANNVARQQDRVRIFEISKTFHGVCGKHEEIQRVGGLVVGPVRPEQWGSKTESVDFFDIKADVESLLALAGDLRTVEFEAMEHVALQPGQAASILRDGNIIGYLGKLHPKLAKKYDLKRAAFVFELDAELLTATQAPSAMPVSRFPAIRRDIAVVVDDSISAQQLIAAITATSPKLIQGVRIFDIYKGSGIEAGRKSVAIGLILQETSRTLTDEDADKATSSAVKKLQDQFAAELRD